MCAVSVHFFDAWVILCVLQKTLSKLERVCKQVKCVKRFEKRLCFENCMNVLGNWARWISYSVLTIEKNCNLKGLLLQQKKEPIRRQKACSRLCTTGYSVAAVFTLHDGSATEDYTLHDFTIGRITNYVSYNSSPNFLHTILSHWL